VWKYGLSKKLFVFVLRLSGIHDSVLYMYTTVNFESVWAAWVVFLNSVDVQLGCLLGFTTLGIVLTIASQTSLPND
jgi:hypothetical protein